MTPLETERLIIRNWEERDRDLFYEINSDEEVMAFFAFRRTRELADAFLDALRTGIETDEIGFTAVEIRETGETIGFVGLHADNVVPGLPAGTVEIGWRLARRYWGKGYASEAARELLRFGFEDLGLGQIVSFAVRDNHRSIAVMRRIGMHPAPEHDFDHPRVPDTHPQFKRHVFYVLTKEDWLARQTAEDAQ